MITAVARWMLRYRLFRRTAALDRPRDVVFWWEARRIPYNAIVGLAGLVAGLLILANAFLTERVTGVPIGLPNPPLFGIIAVIIYGLIANICFTGGWIAELISRKVWEGHADAFGEIAFTLGTLFSVVLTLMPAAILLAVGAFAIVTHKKPPPDAIVMASVVVQCPLATGIQAASFPNDVPSTILSDFRSHVTTLADVGKPFNATDVLMAGLPSRRLILVRHAGSKWVIAYEHGGFAYHDHIVGYEMTDAGSANLIFNVVAYPENVCERSDGWLMGQPLAATTPGRADNDW